jgi:HAD superfamily hydrolase (TIGR01450 family)
MTAETTHGGEPPVIAERFDAFLLDLDGVVYLGKELLPGSKETLSRLRKAGKEIRFLTNDPGPTRLQLVRRLMRMGVEACVDEVISSGWATARYLERSGVESAYVVGSRGLAAEIIAAGVEVVDNEPCDAVVVGSDEHVGYGHLRRASRRIFEGSSFIATNADASFPSPKGPLPGTGAIVEAIRVTTNARPFIVGKPYPPMFDFALQSLNAGRERTLMVGDSHDTDIEGARRAGIRSVLVSRNEVLSDGAIRGLSSLFAPIS